MGMFPSQPTGTGPAAWWGGQGFGGLGSPGAVPQQPATPAVAPAPVGPGTGNMAGWWGGRGVGGPGQQLGTTPGASFTNPAQGQDLWSRLMNAVGNPPAGQFRMPGTTIGAPAGQTPPALPTPPSLPQGQMPTPIGANQLPPPVVPLGTYFRTQQFPQGGNSNQLMSQYMLLQQMMRGT